MFKKYLLFIGFLLVLLSISSILVYAPGCTYYLNGEALSCNYQSGNFYKNADYKNPDIDWNQFDQSKVSPDRINEIPPDKVDVTKIQDQSKLTKPQLTFKDSSGTPNINKVSDWNNLDKTARDPALSELTKKSIVTEGITNGKVVGNGIKFDSIKFLKIDQTSINNCVGCIYDGVKLKFGHADSVLTDKSASTSIDNFDGYEDIFSVEKADSFLSDCIRVDNIKDSELKVSNVIEITTKSNVDLKITDCSFNEVIFSGKGKVIIDKSDNPTYVIENGSLKMKGKGYIGSHIAVNGEAAIYVASSNGYYIYKAGDRFFVVSADNPSIAFEVKEKILPDGAAYYSEEDASFLIIVPSYTAEAPEKPKARSMAVSRIEEEYNETAEANNSIIIETDKTFGFKCLTSNPVGTYLYNDKDLRKDFVINVPKVSSEYRLCLRKNSAQKFQNYDGLVDFVDKKIDLNGIVNYLRYPLKNNQIASLLGNFVYRGLKDINAQLSYDNNLVFLNNIFLANRNRLKGDLSIAYPSNYYTIREMPVQNETHSVVFPDLGLKKSDLTQNINYEYGTDYFELKAKISGNVLTQDNGKNRLLILPPEHERIEAALK